MGAVELALAGYRMRWPRSSTRPYELAHRIREELSRRALEKFGLPRSVSVEELNKTRPSVQVCWGDEEGIERSCHFRLLTAQSLIQGKLLPEDGQIADDDVYASIMKTADNVHNYVKVQKVETVWEFGAGYWPFTETQPLNLKIELPFFVRSKKPIEALYQNDAESKIQKVKVEFDPIKIAKSIKIKLGIK